MKPSRGTRWHKRAAGGWVLALAGMAAGCAAPAPSPPPAAVPAPWAELGDAWISTRAILAIRGREFVLNGYVALRSDGARRLVLTEHFGHVLADLLVRPDGEPRVLRSSPMLRPAWIRQYVAADLACLCGDAPPARCPWQSPEPDRYWLQRRGYTLDLRVVEMRPGPPAAELFEEHRPDPP